jgi:uncharacterized protein
MRRVRVTSDRTVAGFPSRSLSSVAMLFILRFVNRQDAGEILAAHMPAHLRWLESHSDVVLQAGAVRTEPGAPPVGAVWIVEAEDAAAADQVYRSDPFWVNGARESCEVLLWTKAFPDRTVPI